jgi:hypothetical protein
MHELALEWNMQIEKVAVSMFSDMRGLYNEPLYGFSLNIEERVMSKIRIEDDLLGDREVLDEAYCYGVHMLRAKEKRSCKQ